MKHFHTLDLELVMMFIKEELIHRSDYFTGKKITVYYREKKSIVLYSYLHILYVGFRVRVGAWSWG